MGSIRTGKAIFRATQDCERLLKSRSVLGCCAKCKHEYACNAMDALNGRHNCYSCEPVGSVVTEYGPVCSKNSIPNP